MSKVLQRIQEAADLLAAERAAKEKAQAVQNEALEKEADGDLWTLLGEMAEELMACVFERKVYIDLGS